MIRVIGPFCLGLWLAWLAGLAWIIVYRAQSFSRMPFLGAYVGFSAVRTIWLVGVVLGGSQTRYWASYWLFQGIGYTLASLLALSLICSVGRWRQRLCWLGGAVVLLPFAVVLGARSWTPWLSASKWSDIALMSTLALALMWYEQEWQQPQEGLAWGLCVGMGGHAICALLQGEHDPQAWLRACYQLAGVAQLGVWIWTLRRTAGLPLS